MTWCFFSVAWHLNEGVFWSTLRCWSIQHIYYLVSCFDKRDKALLLLAPEVYITNFVFDNRAFKDKLWYDLHVHKIKSYNRSKALINKISNCEEMWTIWQRHHIKKTHCDLKFICICKRKKISFVKKSQKKKQYILG